MNQEYRNNSAEGTEDYQEEVTKPQDNPRERQPFDQGRKSIIASLAALGILAASPNAFADDVKQVNSKNSTPSTVESAHRVKEKHNEEAHNDNHNEPHHGHHMMKAGTVIGISSHPAIGAESTYSYNVSADQSNKFHLVFTPVDFMVAPHHLEIVDGNNHSQQKPMKYFVGGMVGLSYSLNKYIELEAGIGAGAGFIPSLRLQNHQTGGLHYEVAPIIKLDTQIEIPIGKHLRTYIGYSPEVTLTPVAHSITPEGVEKSHHLGHYAALGVGTNF